MSVTRLRPHFRSCSIGITAYRPAVTGRLGALAAADGKRTFWKQKSPIDLDPAEVSLSWLSPFRCTLCNKVY